MGARGQAVSRDRLTSLSLLSSCVCVAVVRCVCVCVPVRVCALLGVSATFLLSPSFVKNKMYTLVSGESCPQCALISLSSLTESLSRASLSRRTAHGRGARRRRPERRRGLIHAAISSFIIQKGLPFQSSTPYYTPDTFAHAAVKSVIPEASSGEA